MMARSQSLERLIEEHEEDQSKNDSMSSQQRKRKREEEEREYLAEITPMFEVIAIQKMQLQQLIDEMAQTFIEFGGKLAGFTSRLTTINSAIIDNENRLKEHESRLKALAMRPA